MPQTLLVRLSEVTLKGRNRGRFQQRVVNNIRRHLAGHGTFQIVQDTARLVLETEDDPYTALNILTGLPGVANVSLAQLVAREVEPLRAAVVAQMESWLRIPQGSGSQRIPDILPIPGNPEPQSRAEAPGAAATPKPATTSNGGASRARASSGSGGSQVAGGFRFRVKVARKDKRYPLRSMELEADLGETLLNQFDTLQVDLKQPQLTVWVEIWDRSAVIYGEKIPGPGGLAVGSSGKVLCLLSGGIDSPVAAYRLMTRGAVVNYLSFHSFPFIGERSKEKVHELVRFLARFQPRSRIMIAPFAKAQEAIRDTCPEGLRTVLYRRLMNRVANRIATQEGAQALVTGESLGQVASQTLENLRAIEITAEIPVLRPLIAHSKQEIIDIARRIGTYSISIQPFPDCCTLFQPRDPETRAKLAQLEQAEAGLPLDELVTECLAGVETTDYGPLYHPAGWA